MIKEVSREYRVYDERGRSVCLTIDFERGEMDIVAPNGKGFDFLGSDPDTAEAVAKLVLEGAVTAKRLLSA